MRPHPLVYRHRRATEDGLVASRESGISQKRELWGLEASRLNLTAKLRHPRRKITAWAV